jgi:hypothetical protein
MALPLFCLETSLSRSSHFLGPFSILYLPSTTVLSNFLPRHKPACPFLQLEILFSLLPFGLHWLPPGNLSDSPGGFFKALPASTACQRQHQLLGLSQWPLLFIPHFCSSYYYCETNHLRLNEVKQLPFPHSHRFCGQDLGKGTVGLDYLYSTVSWASAGKTLWLLLSHWGWVAQCFDSVCPPLKFTMEFNPHCELEWLELSNTRLSGIRAERAGTKTADWIVCTCPL